MLTHRASKKCMLVVMAIRLVFLLFASILIVHAMPAKINLFNQKTYRQANTNNMSQLKIRVEADNNKSPVPVIGVLTQVLRDYKRFVDKHHLHLASSYVKWIESAGAQVLPILLNQNESYYERVFKQTNGLLFPGGDNLLDPKRNTPMMLAAKKLMALAVEANDRGDYYPIWGTCLGLELLSVLSSNKNELDNCDALDETLTMKFVERGKLFEPNKNANLDILNKLDYSKFIMDTLERKPLAYNFHIKCLTDAGLKRAKLENFYRPLAYSYDKNGLKFISIFEAIDYPFFGVQFHPEKPPFEFTHGNGHNNVPHDRESIEVSRYFADFFIRQSQRNGHHVSNQTDIQADLIYAHDPMYTAPLNDIYEQRYLFPFCDNENEKNEPGTLRKTPRARRENIPVQACESSPIMNADSLIEFLEYVPNDDEQTPEDIDHESLKTGEPRPAN